VSIKALNQTELAQSLVVQLGPCVDCIRQIATDLGARPYRCFLIVTQWTGEEEGDGIERVVSEREILPTPKVTTIGALGTEIRSAGQLEVGDLVVREISTRWKDYELRGCLADGSDLPTGQRFFYEIRMDLREPVAQTMRRRFTVSGTPELQASRVQWVVPLKRALGDRKMDGTVDNGGDLL
jgi:hypothetical protein